MSAERNEATVRTWNEEAWNRGNVDSQAHIFSPRYEFEELPAQFGTGFDGLRRFVLGFRAGFSNLHIEIKDVVASGDMVVWRVLGGGTQDGEFMGIPPTGRSATMQAIIMSRFEDGLWREDHVCFDQFGLLQQLGVIPAAEVAAV